MKISRGVKDIAEILPLLNKAFKKNFPALLPKLYSDNKYANDHFIATENDKIIGALASIPAKLIIGESYLNARGIGMVGVNKSARGKGAMSKMLLAASATAEEENVDFMFLSGLRQRYEYYGFTPCGAAIEYTIVKENFKHIKTEKSYDFVRLSENSEYLPEVIKLYNEQNMRYERQDFWKIINSWNNHKHYAVLEKGKVVGHLSFSYKIIDINLIGADIVDVLKSYFEKKCKLWFLKVMIYPNRPDFIKRLSSVSQETALNNSDSFKIINYRNVIKTLLSYNAKTINGADYDIILEIKDYAKMHIKKIGDNVEVSDSVENPDISIPLNNATNVLFSPHLSLINGLPFTLGLYTTQPDNV